MTDTQRDRVFDERSNIILIGMAGAGKTTLGKALAAELGKPHFDTDAFLEAWWGRSLQEIYDAFGRERFLLVEEELVTGLKVAGSVISTGGSVIYGPRAVAKLKELGPIILLRPTVEMTVQRVGDAAGRGLALPEGCTVAQLYAERDPLYKAAADFILDTGDNDLPASITAVRRFLGW